MKQPTPAGAGLLPVQLLTVLTVLAALLFALPFPVQAATSVPSPTSQFYVNDFANVINDSTEQLIMKDSVALQAKTGAQIVVVTIDTLDGAVLEEFSLDLLRTWGIGDKTKNNGVLLLLAVKDRKSRIEVGYGLEGALPDGKTGRIQDDYMLPYYARDQFDAGIRNGYLAILGEVATEYGLDASSIDAATAQTGSASSGTLPAFVRYILIGLGILLLLFDWFFLGGFITRTLLSIMFWRGGFGGGGSRGGGGYRGGGGGGGGGGSSRGF